MSGVQYHPDDYLALHAVITSEGGHALKETCKPRRFSLKIPERGWKDYHTTGCGKQARFEIDYNPKLHIRITENDAHSKDPIVVVDHPGEKIVGGTVTVCAVDDCVGLWPRYKSVINSQRSYQS